MRAVRLEEAGRDGDLERLGERLHREHRLVFADRGGVGEEAFILDAAEILAFEQLGRENDLRALRRGLVDEARDVGDVAVDVGREAQLQRGDGDLGHGRSHNGGCGEVRAFRFAVPPRRRGSRVSGGIVCDPGPPLSRGNE